MTDISYSIKAQYGSKFTEVYIVVLEKPQLTSTRNLARRGNEPDLTDFIAIADQQR